MPTRHELTYQARYAIRLTQRTARLYRRIQTAGTFLSIIGGSGTLSLISASVPNWIGLSSACLLAVSGAAMIAIRPADKAAQNETDTKRYLSLLAKSNQLTDAEFSAALDDAHQSDCQEIEPLRDVAYNDVVTEFGREDTKVKLSLHQSVLAAIA